MATYAWRAVLATLVVSTASVLADEDPVKAKLDAAKAEYQAEVEKFRTAVGDWFDRQEAEARKGGNKKLVDLIKEQRETFATRGELPRQIPATLKAQPKGSWTKLKAAYEHAIKEYIKSKNDQMATVVEEELAEFRTGDGGQKSEPQVADRERQLWVHESGYFLKGLAKDWFEKWDDGRKPPNLFQEVHRTADYIELRHTHVSVTVRLYKDRVTMRDELPSAEFKQLYLGQ